MEDKKNIVNSCGLRVKRKMIIYSFVENNKIKKVIYS